MSIFVDVDVVVGSVEPEPSACDYHRLLLGAQIEWFCRLHNDRAQRGWVVRVARGDSVHIIDR